MPTATAGKLIRRGFDDFTFLLEVPPVRDNPPAMAITDLRAQFPDGVTREKLLLCLESAAGDVVKRSISPGRPWPADLEQLRQVVDWLYEFDMRAQEKEARA